MSYLAGLTEESLKFTALYFFLRNKIDFNEPMDAIVADINITWFSPWRILIMFIVEYFEMQGSTLALIRAFTAIPLYAGCGIIMGFYFGLHVFRGGE